MTYYTHTEPELLQSGIREGELAIYTGRLNPLQAADLSHDISSKNAYVYFWKNGQPQGLDRCFYHDGAGLDVLEVEVGEDTYTFLRDWPSGYIRQLSGPAKPILVANNGAIPLRVDTFQGKFVVYAGTILRLDESAPRREKKKVLVTVNHWHKQPLQSAEIWNGAIWQRLNILTGPSSSEGLDFTIRDGNAIVQHVTVNGKGEILMSDSPEPDPDYEIFITGTIGSFVTLCFNRSDYHDGQVVQRKRKIFFVRHGKSAVYDFQKLRESPTQRLANQCTAELPGRDMGTLSEKGTHSLLSDGVPVLPEKRRSNPPAAEADKTLEQLVGELVKGYSSVPAPEPPEDFPE